MTPIDIQYKTTKLIKKGEASLSSEFIDLTNWIEREYDVKVLNLVHDTIENTNQPRLRIILEYEDDAKKLSSLYGFGTSYQLEKSAPFIQLVTEKLIRSNTEKICIVITSFERAAKEEAIWAISKSEIETLHSEINIPELWKIHTEIFCTATFFLFTNEQVQQFSRNGMKEYFQQKYFELLKRHDEFEYYQKDEFSIELESKENFEKIYENSWFNFDRR